MDPDGDTAGSSPNSFAQIYSSRVPFRAMKPVLTRPKAAFQAAPVAPSPTIYRWFLESLC